MRITCYRHPSLLVTTPRVEFVEGVADVDEETLKALEPLLEDWGIDAADIGGEHAATEPEQPEAPESPEQPETKPEPEQPEAPKRGKRG